MAKYPRFHQGYYALAHAYSRNGNTAKAIENYNKAENLVKQYVTNPTRHPLDKPTIEARTLIWQTMLGGLTRQDAETLASQFDLSGGEIENKARRQSVSAILTGKEELDLNELLSSCRLERIAAQPRRAIGF